ncbi:MAG TPA: carboxypeptidase regulatory-like domain-containing protein [Candidatus Acidoferrales bacterium]|nr:carboxypeptidase regulatory-like domain-containing protein [Candidatus Acidoferrales bacterium]
MKRFGMCVFLLLLSGFVSGALFAQDQASVRGTLGGVVTDPTGAIIQGATVTIMGPTGSAQRTSSEQGEFSFPGLIPGFYDVKVSKDGFKATTVQKVEVGINKVSTIKVALELGAVTQTVEVVASAVSVESQSTAVTADITDTVYQNLPLGRSITNVFYVSPGVASGLGSGTMNPAISGGSGLENAYIADGVLLNDAAFGALGVYQRTYGGIGVGINASFVKEVQVNTAAFGPQYGHTTGGVINMVTKSGGNAFHGVVAGYFQSRGMSAAYANNQDFNPVNKLGSFVAPQAYEGDFELGGYVPLGFLKNHLFFFGAFNPTWNDNYVAPAIGSGLFTSTNGLVDRKDTIWDYSGKVTLQLNQNHSIEASVFGDPTHSNLAPWSTLNIDNTSANSAQTFGSRNLAVRYNGTFGSSFVLDGAFTMNWNQFDENPLNIPEIADLTQTGTGQRGQFRAQGFGAVETYDSVSKGIQVDVHKTVTILGQQHTFSAGYIWNFPTYDDNLGYSGGKVPIQTTNVDGQPIFTGTGAAAVAGQSQEFALQLILASSAAPGATPGSTTCTRCPYVNIDGTPQQVVLQETRGQFSGFTSVNTSKYHAAYVNDDWEMSKYATLSMGVRWEQQRMSTGGGVTQVIGDQWNPRIGFSVDPKGDRKSKIYANFGRYAWVMPLDAAIRELNVENEVENIYYAPVSPNCSGGVCGPASPSNLATLDQFNTVTFDPANVLNNATGGITKNPTVLLISGSGLSSPFAPKTRMEYNDEFVVGAEHEFRGGITASVRYIDRRVKRIIEDFTGISIEQSLAGQAGAYFIGNPSKTTDVTVNPNPVKFTGSALPAACVDSNGVPTPYSATNLTTSLGAALGSICYPSVNEPNTWSVPCGTAGTTGACTAGSFVVDPNALFGGEGQPDGTPDGYPNATRNYQAIEIEVNKSLSHNWSLISNWRIARLRGNFEGAFRNDNGQNDPGISSLYDFTPGVLGELGFQLAPGPLNADRLHIVNVYPTYTFDKTFLKGLIVTPGVKIQSGLPFTTLIAQEPYVNTGEVPIFGRGDLGRGPVTGTVDVHLDYPWRISESKSLHFSVDLMNIANSKRNLTIDQFADVTFGLKSADYQKPGYYPYPFNAAGQNLTTGFMEPFSARFHVAFNF